jgi:hypothetical protein
MRLPMAERVMLFLTDIVLYYVCQMITFFFCEQDNGIKRNNEYALKEITMVAVSVLV